MHIVGIFANYDICYGSFIEKGFTIASLLNIMIIFINYYTTFFITKLVLNHKLALKVKIERMDQKTKSN